MSDSTTSHVSQSGWPSHLDDEALSRTTAYLLDRTRHLSRVIEQAVVTGDVVSRTVTLQAASGPGHHFIALAAPHRDSLIDVVRVSESKDHSTVLASHDDSQLISKLVLRSRCRALDVDPELPLVEVLTSIARVDREYSRFLLTMLERASATPPTAFSRLPANMQALKVLASDQTFMALFRFFRWYMPLWVPVNPETPTFAVKFSFETGRQEYGASSRRELVRSLLGLGSYDFVFPVHSALYAQTYHFRMRAPQNHYLSKCEVLTTDAIWPGDAVPTDLVTTREYAARAPARLQYAARDADGLVHVYFRDAFLDPAKPNRLFIRAQFAERPLGQMGAALLRWGLVTTFLAILLKLGPRLVETQSTLGVAVLLTFPALLGISGLMTAQLGAINVSSGARIASFLSGIAAVTGALSLVAWTVSYGDCLKKHTGPNACSDDAPPGVHAALEALLAASSLLLVYCLLCVVVGLVKFRRAQNVNSLGSRGLTNSGSRSKL